MEHEAFFAMSYEYIKERFSLAGLNLEANHESFLISGVTKEQITMSTLDELECFIDGYEYAIKNTNKGK
jgi:hypothetical protein